jgi:hypothetical protein
MTGGDHPTHAGTAEALLAPAEVALIEPQPIQLLDLREPIVRSSAASVSGSYQVFHGSPSFATRRATRWKPMRRNHDSRLGGSM